MSTTTKDPRKGQKRSFSVDELPLGTRRIRKKGKRAARFIKVRMDGPQSGRWRYYAAWLWEREFGKVPAGKRVCHLDGNPLNDAIENLKLMTPGELIMLHHNLNPKMSEENRRGKKRRAATAEHNRLRGTLNRLLRWLPSRWYAVDEARGVIYNVPNRSRTGLLVEFGLMSKRRKNGGIAERTLRSFPIRPVRGCDLNKRPYEDFQKAEDPGMICRKCGCHEMDACWDEEEGPCAWAEPGLCTHCTKPERSVLK